LAWNKRIFDAGLDTQPYDKGLDRFMEKFDPELQMTTTIAIESQSLSSAEVFSPWQFSGFNGTA
jgi:hypothetical protein